VKVKRAAITAARAARAQVNRRGIDVATHLPSSIDPRFPRDMDDEAVRIMSKALPHTMTTKQRLFSVVEAVRYVDRAAVPGAIVECGVWKGGSMLAAALTLGSLGVTDRELFLYDTFEGPTTPAAVDVATTGEGADSFAAHQRGASYHDPNSLDGVTETLRSSGYPMQRVHLVQGPVEETIPATLPGPIALLRLDTDWYESTAHEMEHLYPLIARGGVLIVDDYGYWEGARRAIDEYVAAHGLALFLQRIDHTGRAAVVP
jgi:O-methyltransferase